MRIKNLGYLIGILLAGCSMTSGANRIHGGGDDTGGGDDGGGDDGGGHPSSDWKQLALVDDNGGSHDVPRAGQDLVTGIYYASANDGYIVTQGAGDSFQDGGAVFKATSTDVTSVAFSGKDGGPSLLGSIDFVDIVPAPGGYVATAYAADVVASTDGGQSFAIAKDGHLGGIEPVLAFRATATATTIVRDTGVVSTAPSMPGPSAAFKDVWAPDASDPIPATVPADECQGAPFGTGVPTTSASAFINSDASLIAYTSAPDFDPQICVSTDHGKSFRPGFIPGVSDDAAQFPPTGVRFTSASHGIAWWAAKTEPGAAYIATTSDGGKTWSSVALPSDVAQDAVELNAAFFAPDNQHGWIVGYDHDADQALALVTTDGGATWATDTTGLAAAVDAADGGALYAGFALDATHVFVGGERGLVLAYAK